MQITLELNDELLERAKQCRPELDAVELIHQALHALIEREAARQLVLLAGSENGLQHSIRNRAMRAR